jgi:hypothetical protein
MDKAQTDSISEAPPTPDEERAARHLRMLARTAEIHMEVMEATRTEAVEEDWHALRVKLAVLAASYESSKDAEEVDRRSTEVCERVERPEVAELIEASRAEVAVAALCRRWGFPPEVERWLEMADEALEDLGFLPSEDGEDDEDPRNPPAEAAFR